MKFPLIWDLREGYIVLLLCMRLFLELKSAIFKSHDSNLLLCQGSPLVCQNKKNKNKKEHKTLAQAYLMIPIRCYRL